MNLNNKNPTLPTIVIVGSPNTGKSSLFNRLIGKRKAIVEAIPGVTRNRLCANISIGKKEARLIDTGGIKVDLKDTLDKLIYKQTEYSIKEADIVLFTCDARTGATPVDYHITSLLRKSSKRIFLLVNKIDNNKLEDLAYDFYQLGIGQPYPISAISRYGIDEFLKDLSKHMDSEIKISGTAKIPQKEKITIAIVGRPNVGKSSFINALLKDEVVLVDAKAGTTRDSVDINFEYQDKVFILIDTAGMKHKRKLRETVDVFSLARSKQSIRKAEAVLVMLSAPEGLCVDDIKIIEYVKEYGKPCAILVNKWDLTEGDVSAKEYERALKERLRILEWMPILFVSCITRKNLQQAIELAVTLKERAKRSVPTPELNKLLEEVQLAQRHPVVVKKKVRIYYATQTQISPQTFILFSNYPNLIRLDYLNFLENSIRSHFGLFGIPIKFKLKEK